jgi:hypothetical protein
VFAAFDAAAWDQQIDDDVKAGRLDRLADTARKKVRDRPT